MQYILTQHAKDVVAEREIALRWVELALNAPETVEPDRDDADVEHRLVRIAEHGNRVLRVIVNRKARPIRIVTVYFDRTRRHSR